MRKETTKTAEPKLAQNPRADAVTRILTIARVIRRQGTPEEASEALEWERQLQSRLQEIESGQRAIAKAA